MQLAITYSWENARAWYEEMGIEVEKGMLEWNDDYCIREMRFNHSRPITHERKDTQDAGRPPLRLAPAGTKACAAYQTCVRASKCVTMPRLRTYVATASKSAM